MQKDSSENILVIVDREQVYGDFWRVCLTAAAQERAEDEADMAFSADVLNDVAPELLRYLGLRLHPTALAEMILSICW